MPATAASRPRMGLDKEPVKEALFAVCAHYAGEPCVRAGSRLSWRCPGCGKRKFEARAGRAGGVAGCWNAACTVPTATDSLGLISHFEGLDPALDFGEVLRRGHALLDPADGAARPSPPLPDESRYDSDPDLRDAVYSAFLELCPPTALVQRFFARRGIEPETVRRANLGATYPKRTREAVATLNARFGRKALLSVPGFAQKRRDGGISFTLGAAPYALIPYHDREGRITTVEGRFIGLGRPPLDAKYLSLRGSGSHLYLFPGHGPDDLEGFCEGPMGAILAAQHGVGIGSIQGYRRHASSGGGPLPELAGTDLGGRPVPYIPDVDDPPRPEVLAEAPIAARSLTLRHNGLPTLVRLREGPTWTPGF